MRTTRGAARPGKVDLSSLPRLLYDLRTDRVKIISGRKVREECRAAHRRRGPRRSRSIEVLDATLDPHAAGPVHDRSFSPKSFTRSDARSFSESAESPLELPIGQFMLLTGEPNRPIRDGFTPPEVRRVAR